jgi:hypothetical protein
MRALGDATHPPLSPLPPMPQHPQAPAPPRVKQVGYREIPRRLPRKGCSPHATPKQSADRASSAERRLRPRQLRDREVP